jgi:hypothetical protein
MRQRIGRRGLLALVALLVLAGLARAAPGVVGPENPSFEAAPNGLPTGWQATILPPPPEEEEPTPVPAPENCEGLEDDPQRAICVLDGDTFTPVGGSPVTVEPLDGDRMVRLGGPFLSEFAPQRRDRYLLGQTFVVDPAKPVLELNYNVFLFDYQGFDELHFVVRAADENGTPIAHITQGGFGSSNNLDLKTTGWRSAAVDLSGYENQQVHLLIDSGGTQDDLYGFWAYIDAGVAPPRPVSPPTVSLPPGSTTTTTSTLVRGRHTSRSRRPKRPSAPS